MSGRLRTPPECSNDSPTPGCAALAALSPLAARTVLRGCAAWDLLDADTQLTLLRRVSSGSVQESAAVRSALAALMVSGDWHSNRNTQRAALERLALIASMPTWFAGGDPQRFV